MHRFFSLPFYIKLACILISLLTLGYIMHVGQAIVIPLVLGLLFALLLVPICNWFESKLRIPRGIAAALALILFFGVIVGIFALIGTQLTMFKEDLPAFEQQITSEVNRFQHWISSTFNIGHRKQAQYLNETLNKSVDKGTAILGVALLSLSSVLILFVFTFLYTLFILIYRRHILRFLVLLNDKKNENIVLEIVNEIQYVVKKYLIGLVLQMLIVSVLVFAVLSIIGVKYSLMLAMVTGILNVLPYIGIFASIAFIALITFATSSATHVLFVIIGLWVVHLVDSNYVVPKIVGSKVKVNSFFAMLAIILGEMIWGISGMFLAIPVLAIIKIVFDRIYDLKAWGYLLGEQEGEVNSFDELRSQVYKEDSLSEEET